MEQPVSAIEADEVRDSCSSMPCQDQCADCPELKMAEETADDFIDSLTNPDNGSHIPLSG